MEWWRVAVPDGVRVGFGQTVAVIASDMASADRLVQPLVRQGARVCVLRGGDRPPDVHLVVLDGDAGGAVADAMPGAGGCPVAVVSGRCAEQTFPPDPSAQPIRLRAPLSAVTARVLMEYIASRQPDPAPRGEGANGKGRPGLRDAP